MQVEGEIAIVVGFVEMYEIGGALPLLISVFRATCCPVICDFARLCPRALGLVVFGFGFG